MVAVPPGAEAIPAKAPDLDDAFLEHEGASRRAEHAFGGFLGAR